MKKKQYPTFIFLTLYSNREKTNNRDSYTIRFFLVKLSAVCSILAFSKVKLTIRVKYKLIIILYKEKYNYLTTRVHRYREGIYYLRNNKIYKIYSVYLFLLFKL